MSLARGIAWTGAAKTAVQALSWVATVAVARLLTPEDYGLIQLATVSLGVVGLVNELSIGLAIVTLRDLSPAQIAQLNGLSLRLGALCTAVTLAAAPLLGRFYDAPLLPPVLFALSPMFLLAAARTVPQGLLQRELRFRTLAFLEASQALVGSVATLGLALLGSGYFSLALGRLASAVWWAVWTLVYRRHPTAPPRMASLRAPLSFSLDVLGANVAWFAYSNLHFLIVGSCLGASLLGVFTIAWTLAHIAVDRIAALLVGVLPSYFSLLSEDRSELRRYFLSISQALAFAVIPVTWGTSLVAADFVPVVLGPRWLEAIGPLQILPLYAAFFALASLLPHLLRVLGETRLCLLCNIWTAVGMLIGVRFATRWGIVGASWVWVAVYPVLTLPLYVRLFARLDVRARDYLRALFPALSCGAAMVAAVLLCRACLPSAPELVRLLAAVAVGAAAYLGYAAGVHPQRIRSFVGLLKAGAS